MPETIVLAGAGQTSRELARRMLRDWSIVMVDPDARKLDFVREHPELAGVRCIQGDATSSLTLRQAGIEGAGAAVALTGLDDVNLEFVRLARQLYAVPKVLVVLRRPEEAHRFEDLGAVVVNRPFSLASVLQSHVEETRRTTSDVGLGTGEILEVTVLPSSPVIGKTLAELSPKSWLVGAIYRRGTLVVPHGETMLADGDRVLLIGDPAILQSIADYFRAGEPEFPLQFGRHIALLNYKDLLTERQREEGEWLAEASHALGVQSWGSNNDAGCVVLPAPPPTGWMSRLGWRRSEFLSLLESIPVPVLVPRGKFPYSRILVTISSALASLRAVELGIDVARVLGIAEITVAAVFPPELVAGPHLAAELETSLEKAAALGRLFRFSVKPLKLQGNPVHQVVQLANDYDLLITAHRRQRRFTLSRPDVSDYLISQAPISTLVVSHGKLPGL
jgi:Trk K+ transport system NAD-binding subunit/nucleotide-binding universal stress UspA family protein